MQYTRYKRQNIIKGILKQKVKNLKAKTRKKYKVTREKSEICQNIIKIQNTSAAINVQSKINGKYKTKS